MFRILLLFSVFTVPIRSQGPDGFGVRYHDYIYTSLNAKMLESLSIGSCSFGPHSDVHVRIIPPTKSLIREYGESAVTNEVIFFRVLPGMCNLTAFKRIESGSYKRLGCVKRRDGRSVKFEHRPAMLHPYHNRCNNELASQVCWTSSQAPLAINIQNIELRNYPFLVTVRNAIISRSGQAVLPCGLFGLYSSCEAVSRGANISRPLIRFSASCQNSAAECPFRVVGRVFVMTQYDDTQIGQFLLEALPKLIYHLDYIKENRDIYIHFGYSKRDVLPRFVLPHLFLRWLGLEDRLINGTVFATEAALPREGGCQDVSYNAWEAVHMRGTLIMMANQDSRADFISSNVRRLVIISRSRSKYAQNLFDYKLRRWPPRDFLPNLVVAFQDEFPELQVEVFFDSNETIMSCQSCQIKMFSTATIVVGFHGAGLAHTLFMPRGGVVVELTRDFNSKHAPAIGIFSILSRIVGLNHFLYFVDEGSSQFPLEPQRLVRNISDFARRTSSLL
jgi:hypothetical protein